MKGHKYLLDNCGSQGKSKQRMIQHKQTGSPSITSEYVIRLVVQTNVLGSVMGPNFL